MINFDELPQDKPAGEDKVVLPKGRYYATIHKAEMRKAKNTDKEYLQVTLAVDDHKGNKGFVFDRIFDSDKGLLQYKLAQFLRALPNSFSGSFELSDLPRIIVGKKLIVQIKITEDAQYGDKNEVDIFDDFIYSKWGAEAPAEDNPPFDPDNGDY